jgi:aminotransferase in exopolysaccharide biosynthesis
MNNAFNDKTVQFVKSIYNNDKFVPLHSPVFLGNEKKYLNNCIDTTFVSYVGEYVTKFEEMNAAYSGSKYAVAVVNGTVAIQVALQIAGVESGDEVITQPLTFVATTNAISHAGAIPVFVDVDIESMGMSSEKLYNFLKNDTKLIDGKCLNKTSNRIIKAVVPMHTFGHSCKIDEIINIANEFNIVVIEDSAESLGTMYRDKHTGTFGLAGILSFNGNKTVTTGGGGMIITDNEEFAKKAKHITTTGKVPHQWEFIHDTIAYNFRLTNLNAAIGVAQFEYIDKIIKNKRETANLYKDFFKNSEVEFVSEPEFSRSTYWLNAIKFKNRKDRDEFLKFSNENGIQTRPIWRLMNKLPMYQNCQFDNIDNALWLEDRIVNIPSGLRI